MYEEPLFDKLTLIGLGLIGSSIARAARAHKAVREIAALDASPQVLARVRELNIVDDASGDVEAALSDAAARVIEIEAALVFRARAQIEAEGAGRREEALGNG